MKNVIFTFAMSLVLACSAQKSTLQIPANKSVQIDYPDYALCMASLNNKSMAEIRVVVVSKADNDTIRGFGLANKGKADVMVERNAYLCLINSNGKPVEISVGVSEQDPVIMEKPAKDAYRSFTLRNNSAKSIPLQIPGVMNPNLSPFSNSGVDLKMGQEIFFTYKGKKRILLIVDENIDHGDVVDVSKLLKERKKEIDASAGSARE
jgi:hypothetical protein